MDGRPTALVTGSTSGIGLALATELASRDVSVVVHGRTEGSAKVAAMRGCGYPAADSLPGCRPRQSGTGPRRGRRGPRSISVALSLLIHNAGIQQAAFRVVDGHAGRPWRSINGLLPADPRAVRRARGNGPARLIFVNSAAHSWGTIHWDDLVGYRWYQPDSLTPRQSWPVCSRPRSWLAEPAAAQ